MDVTAPQHRTAVVTWVLLALNLLGFAFELARGASAVSPTSEELLAVGADFGPYVLDGQWWRLITAAFLHAGVMHLALNLSALIVVGPVAERAFGRVGYALLYLASAISGSLASITWTPLVCGVGASGALFGLYAAVGVLSLSPSAHFTEDERLALRKRVFTLLAYNLVFGAMLPFVDNAAHVGGLLMGAVVALALGARRRLVPALAVTPLLLVFATFTAMRRVEQVPEVHAGALGRQADELVAKKKYSEALTPLAEALKLTPNHAPYHRLQGWLYSQLGHPEAAERALAESLRLNADDPEALSLRCYVRIALKKWDESLKDCEAAVARNPKDVSTRINLMSVLEHAQRWDELLAQGEKLLEMSPSEAQAHRMRGTALFNKGAPEEAAASARKAFELAPHEPSVAYLMASTLDRAGRQEEARTVLEAALQRTPEQRELRMFRADLLAQAGNPQEAIAETVRLLETPDASSSNLWNNLARYRWQLGDKRALDDLDRALELSPQDPHALRTRCWIHASLGDHASAIADCTRASDKLPDRELDLGMIRFLKRDYSGAIAAWESADPRQQPLLADWIARAKKAGGKSRRVATAAP